MNRTTFGDVVVTAHELATQAGMEILTRGGNAIDAAVAANATLGVVAPETCGIGGDLFALVHQPGSDSPLVLNASGWAGSGFDTEHIDGVSIPLSHPASVTIPGCVQGWEHLAERLGTMPIASVLAPAIQYAKDGFPVSVELAKSLDRRANQLAGQAAGKPLYGKAGAPVPGTWISRPQLQRTLETIASEGALGFYEGPIAQEISDSVHNYITRDDLAAYQPDWVEPLSLEAFGHTGWTVPPNSQGYLTLAASRIFELCDAPTDPLHPDYLHLAIEAYRSVAASRDGLLSDERTAATRDELIGEEMLMDRASRIDPERAGVWPSLAPGLGGTTYLATMDRTGLAVSLIQSNFHGIGSGIGAGSAGFFLHNRGAGFTLEPGHRNELVAGRRPAHTLAPSLWTLDGEVAMVLGTRGGHQQPQLLSQVAAHVLHAKLSPADAQAWPRWTTSEFRAGQGSLINVESRLDQEIVQALEDRGHRIHIAGEWEGGWGPVSMISVDSSGLRTAAADPRVATASAGVR